MRRYSQVFLVVALFCFLFPFIAIAPAKNVGFYPMTGWDMLTTQNVGLSKQPPVVLHIPLRAQIILAILCGAAAILVMLAKRKDAAWIAAGATIVAAVSLFTITTTSLPIQVTDGQNVLYNVEDPPFQILPGFYVALSLMGAAMVSSLVALRKPRQVAVRAATAAAVPLPALQQPQNAHSFCIKCGMGLAEGAKFCNRCGSVALGRAAAPHPIPPPIVNQPPSVSASPIAAPVPVQAATPAAAPAQVSYSRPQVIVPSAPQVAAVVKPRFSFAVRLGLVAAGVLVGVLVWVAVHQSTDNSASVGAASISIVPTSTRVSPGGTVMLQVLVDGGRDREVQWSIAEGTYGGSVEQQGATVQNGTVFMQANYKAPLTPGTYHVVAASAADPTRKATAQVVVEYGWRRP